MDLNQQCLYHLCGLLWICYATAPRVCTLALFIYCRTYFIRGMQTLEVSVAVLWGVVKRSKVNLVEWWRKHIKEKKKDSKEELKPWQVQLIATHPWEEWDISLLSYAIRNCHDFPNEDYEDLRECAKKLNDIRSDSLCHEQRAQIAFDKYIRILHTSMECYKRLIAEKEAYMEYIKQLKNISASVRIFHIIM